ncbi:hypothetical protein FHG87_004971, partial [Trinorchestia longiramus]
MVMNTFKLKLRKRRDEFFRRTSDEDADEWQFVPFNPSVFSGATLSSSASSRNGSAKGSGPLRPWALQRASWHDGAPPVPAHQRGTDVGLYLPVGPGSELYPGSVPQWYGAQLPVSLCNGSAYPQSVPSGQARPAHISSYAHGQASLSEDDEVLYRRPMTAKRSPRPRPVSAGNVAAAASSSQAPDSSDPSPPVPPHKSVLDSRTAVPSPRHTPVHKSKSIPPTVSAVPFSSYSPRPLSSKSAYHSSNVHQNNSLSLAPVPDQREEDNSSPSPEYTLPVSCSSDASSSDSNNTPPPVPQHKEPFASFMNPPRAARCQTMTPVQNDHPPLTPPPGWSSCVRPDARSPALPKHVISAQELPPPVPNHATRFSTRTQSSVPPRPPPHKTLLSDHHSPAKPHVPTHNNGVTSKWNSLGCGGIKPVIPHHAGSIHPSKELKPPVPRHQCLSSKLPPSPPPPPPPHSAPFPLTHSLSCPSGPLPSTPDSSASGPLPPSPMSCPSGPLPRSPESPSEELFPNEPLPPLPPEPCLESTKIPNVVPHPTDVCPERSLPPSPVPQNGSKLVSPVPLPRTFGVPSNKGNSESNSSLQSAGTSDGSVSQNALLPVKPAIRRSHCRQSSLPPPPLYQNMYQPVEFQSNESQPVAYQRLDEWSSVERLSLSNPNIGASSNQTSDAELSLDSFGSSSSLSRNSSRLSSRQSSHSSRHSPWLLPSPEDELQGLIPLCQHLLDSPPTEERTIVTSSADAASTSSSSSNQLCFSENNRAIDGNERVPDGQKGSAEPSVFSVSSISGALASMRATSLNSIDGIKSTHPFEEIRHQNGEIELLQIIEEPESFEDGDECDYACEVPSAADDTSSIHFIDSTSCSLVSSMTENTRDNSFKRGDGNSSVMLSRQLQDTNLDFSHLIPPRACFEDDLSIPESPSPEPQSQIFETECKPESSDNVSTFWESCDRLDDIPEFSHFSFQSDDVTDLSWCYSEPRPSFGLLSPTSLSCEPRKRSTHSPSSLSNPTHLLSLSNCLRSSSVHPISSSGASGGILRRPPSSLNWDRPRSSCFERPSPSTTCDLANKFVRPRSLFSALQSPSFSLSPSPLTPDRFSSF